MSAVHSLVDDVETAFRDGTKDSRALALRRITDLFLVGVEGFKEEHVGVFDDVLCSLVDRIERQALIELSTEMAPLNKAPPRLCRRLSWHDDIEIAGPVLRQSPLLTDSELVELAQRKSQLHLIAIASRAQVSERVSDVLVDRGNSTVLTTVARNRGARFSSRGYRTIMGRAGQDPSIASALMTRPDLSPEMFRKLLAQATETVREKLMTSADPETKARLQGVLQSISVEIASDRGRNIDMHDASGRPMSASDKSRLRAELLDYASSHRTTESAIALSAIAELPLETVRHAMGQRDPEALLIVCKACGLPASTVRAILELDTRGDGSTHPAAYVDQYNRLSRETADRIMRFLKVRKTVSDAEMKKAFAS